VRVRVAAEGFATQTLDLTAGESLHKVKLERARTLELARADKPAPKRARVSRPRRTTKTVPASTAPAARGGAAGHDSYEKFSP
jgi:hypothetical protein